MAPGVVHYDLGIAVAELPVELLEVSSCGRDSLARSSPEKESQLRGLLDRRVFVPVAHVACGPPPDLQGPSRPSICSRRQQGTPDLGSLQARHEHCGILAGEVRHSPCSVTEARLLTTTHRDHRVQAGQRLAGQFPRSIGHQQIACGTRSQVLGDRPARTERPWASSTTTQCGTPFCRRWRSIPGATSLR